MKEPPFGNEKLTKHELFGDPRNICGHARAILLEQIIHVTGGNRARRTELEQMNDVQLREVWEKIIGEPATEVGI